MKLPYLLAENPLAQERANKVRALTAVHLFGHIRHAELARLMWPNAKPEGRAVAASRLFKRYTDEKFIVRRINSWGSYSYVLGARGAMWLGRVLPESVREGTRISGIQGRGFFHRTLGSAWMVDQLLAGHDVYPEFAINSNRYEISRVALAQRWGKLPDGLVLREVFDERGQLMHYAVDWLEVESTHKGLKERSRVMDMLWVLGRPLIDGLPYYLDRLVLLYDATSSHELALTQSAIQKWREVGHQIDDPRELLGSVIMTEAVISKPLTIQSFHSQDLYTLLQRGGLLPELSKPYDVTEPQPDFEEEPDYE